jgi:hypothetical protein
MPTPPTFPSQINYTFDIITYPNVPDADGFGTYSPTLSNSLDPWTGIWRNFAEPTGYGRGVLIYWDAFLSWFTVLMFWSSGTEITWINSYASEIKPAAAPWTLPQFTFDQRDGRSDVALGQITLMP